MAGKNRTNLQILSILVTEKLLGNSTLVLYIKLPKMIIAPKLFSVNINIELQLGLLLYLDI